ncbi:MAG: DNA primase [Oscillospiraceae bacterium]|jgi:DNA primase|nr:DNA primase [Oscillospiraceae bacterium]
MAFPGAFLDELTVKTDMIALVSQYTQPVRRGSRWFARCPFHSEKTPSFTVTPESGLFYCFGCQAGGGPIQFIMRAENLEFSDAVRYLAGRLGLAVPEDSGDLGLRVKRERLIEVNRLAARWFYERLGSEEGRLCAEYMRSRGMKPDMARRFGLGYAPDRWDGLLTAMAAAGVSADEMSVAGLVSRNQRGGLYDAFRDRLVFPIFDLRGQVVAFSGRALGDGMPKYKNSAESPVYQKRGLLYGAHIARKSEQPYWILAEGNVDVFMLHQAGFDNAVATCGTALTDTQARLAARHVKELTIAYDADAAGQNATQKAVTVLEAAGVRVRILHMRGAKDPDDFIRAYGPEGFAKLINDSQNHIEYRLSLLEARYPANSDAEKMEYLREATRLLAELPTRGEREIYSARVADTLGIDSKAVSKDVEAAGRKRGKAAEKAFEAQVIRPETRDRVTARKAAEEQALALLLRLPELETSLTAEDFETEEHRLLFENRFSPLSGETAALCAGLLTRYEEMPNALNALADCEKRIKNPRAKYANY